MVPPAVLASALRSPDTIHDLCSTYGEGLLDLARAEGIAPYLAWLAPQTAALVDDRRRAVLRTALQHDDLQRACRALVQAGITPTVFKGGAWAYTDYPEPWCRPSLDMDILIDPAERERAFAVLDQDGYRRVGMISGTLVSGQEIFERTVAGDTTLAIDLHWRISNRVWLAEMLPTRDVRARAVGAPFVGPGVRRVSDEDGLLLACLHPPAHHATEPALKWVLDVVRLVAGFDDAAARVWLARVEALGVSALVAAALERAWTIAPDDVRGAPLLQRTTIARLAAVETGDAARAWLQSRRGRLQDAIDDLKALSSWRARGRLIREHLVPPRDFIHAQYGDRRRWMLPVWYTHRAVVGGMRWTLRWLRDRSAG